MTAGNKFKNATGMGHVSNNRLRCKKRKRRREECPAGKFNEKCISLCLQVRFDRFFMQCIQLYSPWGTKVIRYF